MAAVAAVASVAAAAAAVPRSLRDVPVYEVGVEDCGVV